MDGNPGVRLKPDTSHHPAVRLKPDNKRRGDRLQPVAWVSPWTTLTSA